MRRLGEREPWYKPRRNGSLEQYLLAHMSASSGTSIFRGHYWYREMRKRGYIVPGSEIRLLWSIGNDEFYAVDSKYMLKGQRCGPFSGKPGTHDPRKILTYDGTVWEVQSLDYTAIVRKLEEMKVSVKSGRQALKNKN